MQIHLNGDEKLRSKKNKRWLKIQRMEIMLIYDEYKENYKTVIGIMDAVFLIGKLVLMMMEKAVDIFIFIKIRMNSVLADKNHLISGWQKLCNPASRALRNFPIYEDFCALKG